MGIHQSPVDSPNIGTVLGKTCTISVPADDLVQYGIGTAANTMFDFISDDNGIS